MSKYTQVQVETMLDMYYHGSRTMCTWGTILVHMGLDDASSLPSVNRLRWAVVTGYSGDRHNPTRREFQSSVGRRSRADMPWSGREDNALRDALGGKGQTRQPPCDAAHVARVLARSEAEIRQRWGLVEIIDRDTPAPVRYEGD